MCIIADTQDIERRISRKGNEMRRLIRIVRRSDARRITAHLDNIGIALVPKEINRLSTSRNQSRIEHDGWRVGREIINGVFSREDLDPFVASALLPIVPFIEQR